VIAPITWEWHTHRQAGLKLVNLQTQLDTASADRLNLQTEIDRYQHESNRLAGILTEQSASAARQTASAEKFELWKQRLHGLLNDNDYRWPADSPFVRIPKAVVKQLDTGRPVRPPGALSQAARELLGLTPQEREQLETAFHNHFAEIDQLIDSRLYETNALSPYAARFGIPAGAVASQVWTIPPLGDEVNTQAKSLEASLQATLGPERWSMVEGQLGMLGTDTLRRILNLDAAQNPQQIAVWIFDQAGEPTVGYGWQGNGGAFSRSGTPLDAFKTDPSDSPRIDPADLLGAATLPKGVVERIMDWVQQQATTLPAK
jgi:hypothetical protein